MSAENDEKPAQNPRRFNTEQARERAKQAQAKAEFILSRAWGLFRAPGAEWEQIRAEKTNILRSNQGAQLAAGGTPTSAQSGNNQILRFLRALCVSAVNYLWYAGNNRNGIASVSTDSAVVYVCPFSASVRPPGHPPSLSCSFSSASCVRRHTRGHRSSATWNAACAA